MAANIVSKNGGLIDDTWNVNAQMMEAYINEVYDKELPWDKYVQDVYILPVYINHLINIESDIV